MSKHIVSPVTTPHSLYGGGDIRGMLSGKGKSMAYKSVVPKGARTPKKPRKV